MEYMILFFDKEKLFTCFVTADSLSEARRLFESFSDGEICHIQSTSYQEFKRDELNRILG